MEPTEEMKFQPSTEEWDEAEARARQFFAARGSYGGGLVSWDIAMRACAIYALWVKEESAEVQSQKGMERDLGGV